MTEQKIGQHLLVPQDDTVKVELYRRTNGTHYVRVVLRSRVRPSHKSYAILDPDNFPSRGKFERAVEIAGGALAERQALQYGDRHEPSEIARLALEAWRELLAEAERR